MPDFSVKDNKIIPIIVLVLIGLSIYSFNKLSKNPTLADEIVTDEDNYSERNIKRYIFVDINGAIKNRGVYKLKSGSRMMDLVRFAGGVHDYADMNDINLAEVLKDGQKIKIPCQEYEQKYTKKENPANNKRVSINNAMEQQLDVLPGVGLSTARKIIEYRNKNGPFKQIEELKNVPGIGNNKFEILKKLISL